MPSQLLAPVYKQYSRDSIQVNLLYPADDGGLPIEGYMVLNSTDGANWATINITHSTQWYLGLFANTPYYFKAAAINSLGMGPISDTATLSTAAAMCGDGICDAGESCRSCYLDCGACGMFTAYFTL